MKAEKDDRKYHKYTKTVNVKKVQFRCETVNLHGRHHKFQLASSVGICSSAPEERSRVFLR